MAVKKGNTLVHLTVTPFHKEKFSIICARTGLSKTGLLQRWIENFELFPKEQQELDEKLSSPSS